MNIPHNQCLREGQAFGMLEEVAAEAAAGTVAGTLQVGLQ